MNRADLSAVISAFRPEGALDDPRLFSGRHGAVGQLAESLHDSGSIVIIYGDRGLGKTSLSNQYELMARGDSSLLDRFELGALALSATTYFDVVRLDGAACQTVPVILGRAIAEINALKEVEKKSGWLPAKRKRKLGVSFRGITGEQETEYTSVEAVGEETDVDIEDLLLRAVDHHAATTQRRILIIIDEFDRVSDRKQLAALLTRLRSRGDNPRLCLVGIGEHYQEFVYEHRSLERSLNPIRVFPMSTSELKEICPNAVANLRDAGVDVAVNPEANELLCKLADGYPWYIHILGRSAFKHAALEDRLVVTAADVERALKKLATERGALKYENLYQRAIASAPNREIVLKFVAMHSDSTHELVPMEDLQSYLLEVDPDIDTFQHVKDLRNKFGILSAQGPQLESFVQFDDPAFRVYCRLRPAIHRLSDARIFSNNTGYQPTKIARKWQARWSKEERKPIDGATQLILVQPILSRGSIDLGTARQLLVADLMARRLTMDGKSTNTSLIALNQMYSFRNLSDQERDETVASLVARLDETIQSIRQLGFMAGLVVHRGDDPINVRSAQRVFLEMFRRGVISLIYTRGGLLCPDCEMDLVFHAPSEENCQKCGADISGPDFVARREWEVRIDKFRDRLLQELEAERAQKGSNLVKKELQTLKHSKDMNRRWVVSSRSPIGVRVPLAFCEEHGFFPMPEDFLPLTDDSLAAHSPICQSDNCAKPADPETRRLDVEFESMALSLVIGEMLIEDPVGRRNTNRRRPIVISGLRSRHVDYLIDMRIAIMSLDRKDRDTGTYVDSTASVGTVLSAGRAMSKSLGIWHLATDLIDQVGVDAFRLTLLSSARGDVDADWGDVDSLNSWNKFLKRLWTTYEPENESRGSARGEKISIIDSHANKTILLVTEFMKAQKYPNALSALRQLLTTISREGSTPFALDLLILLLYPFAPHISSEIWERRFGRDLTAESWPKPIERLTKEEASSVPVHVNGPKVASVVLRRGDGEKRALAAALALDNVVSALNGRLVAQAFFKQGRAIVIVTNDSVS